MKMNMARSKRTEKISGLLLGKIEDQIGQLRLLTRSAMISLAPFRPHYDGIHDLNRDLTKALNLLHDRPADYEEPHHAPFSQSEPSRGQRE
jgi:hypothetical protein